MTLLDEWVQKAEADFKSATDLNRRRKEPVPDNVCYLCQQSAEKYLKAYLVAQGDTPPRTHKLDDLLNLCVPYDSALSTFMPAALLLNQYAVDIRYPGASATVDEAKEAMKTLRAVRQVLRQKLGL